MRSIGLKAIMYTYAAVHLPGDNIIHCRFLYGSYYLYSMKIVNAFVNK